MASMISLQVLLSRRSVSNAMVARRNSIGVPQCQGGIGIVLMLCTLLVCFLTSASALAERAASIEQTDTHLRESRQPDRQDLRLSRRPRSHSG